MDSIKNLQDKPKRQRRLKNNEPDPEWTYTPPPLSEQAERFLAWWVEQHLPSERGLTPFMHVPILRNIIFWLEQPEGGPTEERRQRAGSHEANVHVASHADLLMFGAGKRAERERVFIEIVEGLALLSFVKGGIPPLPELCEAHDAEVLASAFAAFKESEQSNGGDDS